MHMSVYLCIFMYAHWCSVDVPEIIKGLMTSGYSHCSIEQTWANIVGSPDSRKRYRSGGLGKRMVPGEYHVWLCDGYMCMWIGAAPQITKGNASKCEEGWMSLDCTICAEGRHGHLCMTSCAMGTTYDEDSNQCTPLGILPTVISLIFLARASLPTNANASFLSLSLSHTHSLSFTCVLVLPRSLFFSFFLLFPLLSWRSHLYDAKESFMSHMD